MKKNTLDLISAYRNSQNMTILVGYILVSLMMVTVAAGFAQLGGRLFPRWNGVYLVAIGLVVSLEAIYTRKKAKELDFREKLIFRISEWVAFAVAVKLLLYALNGFGQLLIDLPRWQENFILNFFTGEYILALFVIFIIWWSSSAYANELEELLDRESDAEWDELGKLQNMLHSIRARITARVFMLGTLVVALAVLSRIDASAILRERGIPTPGYNAPVANVLIYFILALVLLSLTQFALLRTRWLWQRMQISPQIARNWVKFGLLFFLFLAVIVFFLPTEYSLGLFDTLRIFVDFLFQAMNFLMFLVLLPFTICMSLFSLTAGQERAPQVNPPMAPPPVAPSAAEPVAWLEFLRSLLFWAIFVGIIFFAVRYYLVQNVTLWNALRRFPLVRWLGSTWESIRSFFRGANRQITGLVRLGIDRLRPKHAVISTGAVRRFFNLARMSPREKIIHFYVSLVELGGERGIERRPNQTPYQYESRLTSALPEINEELHGLTDTFLEARYSRHAVEEPQSEWANRLWEKIKAVLRSWKRKVD